MAIPGTTPVPGTIAPTSELDTYSSHSEKYGAGGYRTVDTISERNSISTERLVDGMLVFVKADGTTYRRSGSTWVPTSIDSRMPFQVADSITQMRGIVSSAYNRICILLGESAAFDGIASGLYIAVPDPSETATDNGLSTIVPNDRASAQTVDKMYWVKLSL